MILEQHPLTMEASFTRRKYGRGKYLLQSRVVEKKQRDLRSRFSVVFLFSIEWIHCRKISIWGSFVVQWLSSQCQPLRMRFN
jgi:hypothetical protein